MTFSQRQNGLAFSILYRITIAGVTSGGVVGYCGRRVVGAGVFGGGGGGGGGGAKVTQAKLAEERR